MAGGADGSGVAGSGRDLVNQVRVAGVQGVVTNSILLTFCNQRV